MTSDEQLRDEILVAIRNSLVANAASIRVDVRDGVVTLTGYLNNHVEQWDLEKSMRDVSGIAALDFDLDFAPFWPSANASRVLAGSGSS